MYIKWLYFMFKNVDEFLVIFCSVPFLVLVGWCGRNVSHGNNLRHFRPSCVRMVFFYVSLHSFTTCRWSVKELSFVSYFLFLTNRQRSLAKRFPLPYSPPDHSSITPLSLPGQIMLQFTLQFLMLLSRWRCRPVFLSLEC